MNTPLRRFSLLLMLPLFAMVGCEKQIEQLEQASTDVSLDSLMAMSTTQTSGPILLAIDEESIDNGQAPNNFTEVQVNDQLAKVGLRQQLDYFRRNLGKTIELFTGEVGDEGWHALKTIPQGWINAGPTNIGARNYLQAGPGLGSGRNNTDDNKEILLEKIPNVTPLRATGLAMLTGKTVIAVVYDAEISINYGPLNGNLMGANLGIVAFEVVKVTERKDGSSGSLPKVSVVIKNATEVATGSLHLFINAPVPQSSSVPYDTKPANTNPAARFVVAK